MFFKLRKPVEIDGEMKAELAYDLDELTAEQFEDAIRELGKRNYIVKVQEMDPAFHAALFAQAAGITYADMLRLNAKDYSAAGILVRNFFYVDAEDSQE